MAIQNLRWGLGQPVPGAVADHFGPGRVLTAGAVLYAAGTAPMALSTSPLALHLTGGLLLARTPRRRVAAKWLLSAMGVPVGVPLRDGLGAG